MSNTPGPFAALAAQLNASTTNGDLIGAYAIIRRLSQPEAQSVSLEAGYSVIGGPAGLASRGALFWRHLQSQIAQAARLRTDGFGVQEHRRSAA